jgi:tetratricopeptide (TPR) repeat protein
VSSSEYKRAASLIEAKSLDAAWAVVKALLLENPNDPQALVLASVVERLSQNLPTSYHFAKAASRIIPNDAAPWINLGHTASEMWLVDESEAAYRKALKCPNIESGSLKRNTMLNIAALYIDNGRYEEARQIVDKWHKINPNDTQMRANLGFCQLAVRDWSGWANYHSTLGSNWRPRVQYMKEPEWDGTPGKTVVLYGEQGLGDEISFASMLPDAIRHCKRVILDCDPRLKGLFQRSFPGLTVHGTRTAQAGHMSEDLKWPAEDRVFDASLAIGQIGEYYRTKAEDFPGTPYLVPCPVRVQMWRALFEAKGKPTIGVAWTGGVPKNNSRNRRLDLEQLLPFFRKHDAHYISLQYWNADREIAEFKERYPEIDLVQYKFATLTGDYDDTAALIACLDHVVCIQTSVAHTAGALGTPVTVLVPQASQWRYGTAHDSIPWYKSLRIIRQRKSGQWRDEIQRIDLPGLSGAAGKAPPEPLLRDGELGLCPDDLGHHRENGRDASSGLRMRA